MDVIRGKIRRFNQDFPSSHWKIPSRECGLQNWLGSLLFSLLSTIRVLARILFSFFFFKPRLVFFPLLYHSEYLDFLFSLRSKLAVPICYIYIGGIASSIISLEGGVLSIPLRTGGRLVGFGLSYSSSCRYRNDII